MSPHRDCLSAYKFYKKNKLLECFEKYSEFMTAIRIMMKVKLSSTSFLQYGITILTSQLSYFLYVYKIKLHNDMINKYNLPPQECGWKHPW